VIRTVRPSCDSLMRLRGAPGRPRRGPGLGVKGEAIERDAQRSLEHHPWSLEGQRLVAIRPRRWRRARDRRRGEQGQAIAVLEEKAPTTNVLHHPVARALLHRHVACRQVPTPAGAHNALSQLGRGAKRDRA